MIPAAIGGAIMVGSALYNIGSQLYAANQQKNAAEEQKAYYKKVAADVKRKGAVQISQLKVSGQETLGQLDSAAASSGVAMTGTAADIKDLSEQNLATDIANTKLDIAAAVETAKMTGEQTYSNTMAKANQSSMNAFNSGVGLTNNLLGKTEQYLQDTSGAEDTGFVKWLSY